MNELLLRCKGRLTRISLFFIGFILAFSGSAQTVTTDKDDYVPGEYVIITGAGWEAGERVDFVFEETPKPETCVNSHDLFAIADSEGNIYNNQFLIKENHLGVSFVLTATGLNSGFSAFTAFTDGQITFAASGLPNGITINVSWEYPQGSGTVTGSSSFITPNKSNSIGLNNKSLSFTYPSNIDAGGGVNYSYVSANRTSSFETGNGSTAHDVIGQYQLVCNPPSSNGQPISVNIPYGSNASFSIGATGTAPLIYKWEISKNNGISWTNVSSETFIGYSGSNSSTLNIAKPLASMSGYRYRCIASNSCGVFTSNISPVAPAILTVTKKDITGSFTAVNKIYDGDYNTTVSTRTLTGALVDDDVLLVGGSANFSNKNVGNGKTVILSGAVLSGTDAGNYNLASVGTTIADITVREVNVTAQTDTKAYDGDNTSAVLPVGGALQGADVYASIGTQTFNDKDVATGKTMMASGASITDGNGGANYNINYVDDITGEITKLDVTGSFAADNKVYDSNAGAVVTEGSRSVSFMFPGDDLILTGGTASFSDKNVANGKIVTISGAVLSGTDAGNYNLASVNTALADITAFYVTASFAADNKVYDSNTIAVVTSGSRSLAAVFSGDDLSLIGGTASFSDKDVANGKTVTLSGAGLTGWDAGNYNLASVNTALADITAFDVTGSFAADNKVYDSNAGAVVTAGSRSVSAVLPGDDLILTGGTANFSDKNVANGKTVTLSGAVLSGTDAGNYNLASVNTALADITAFDVTGSFAADNKVYDSNASAVVTSGSRFVEIVFVGDDISLTGGNASFNNMNVGDGKTITLLGAILSGADAGNYKLASVNTTLADITARPITITVNSGQFKYCGLVDPKLSYTHSISSATPAAGLAGSDLLDGELTRVPGELAGNYNILLAGLSIKNGLTDVSSNYNIDFKGTTFEIKRAILDASISSQAVQINTAPNTAVLSAKLLDVNSNPIVGGSVNFVVLNNAGQSTSVDGIGITGLDGVARTSEINTGGLPIGVYTVLATFGCEQSTAYLTIFDPNGDFVTGGGWINSPKVSDVNDSRFFFMKEEGKASFGFVAKYKKGKSEVDGNTEFQFKTGNLNFKSNFHDSGSLVISGVKATYRGEGTINGTGNYGFMISAIDGDEAGGGGTDRFRIKIWDKNSGNTVVYDYKMGAADNADINTEDFTKLGGGSIVIHKPKSNLKSQEVVTKDAPVLMQDLTTEVLETLALSPNPVVSSSTVRFSVNENSSVTLRVYDYSGRLVETLFTGAVKAFENTDVEFQRNNLMSGIYILKLTTHNGNSYDKRIIVE